MSNFQLVSIEEVARFLPPSQDACRWLAVAEKVTNDPKIAECSTESIRDVLLKIAATGLPVDGKHASIVAYAKKATLQIGYIGYIALARENGYQITPGIVREGDAVEDERGTNPTFWHSPLPFNEGPIIGGYAYVKGPDGFQDWETVSVDHCLRVRECSRGYKSAVEYRKDHPWMESHVGFPEMVKKTAIKLVAKRLKLSPAAREAIERDTQDDLPAADDVRIVRPSVSPLSAPAAPAALPLPKPGPLDRRVPKGLADKAGWPAEITVNQALHEQGEDGKLSVGLLLKTIEEAPAESRAKVAELEAAIRAVMPKVEEVTE